MLTQLLPRRAAARLRRGIPAFVRSRYHGYSGAPLRRPWKRCSAGVRNLWTCPRRLSPRLSGRGRSWGSTAGGFLTIRVTATCIGCSPKWELGTTGSGSGVAGACQARLPTAPPQGSQAVEGGKLGGVYFCSVIYLMVGNFYNL